MIFGEHLSSHRSENSRRRDIFPIGENLSVLRINCSRMHQKDMPEETLEEKS